MKVIYLSASIFPHTLLLTCFFQYVRRVIPLNTAPGCTPARHSDKSQHRETQLYLHSASIGFWKHGFGIEFFPLLAHSFLLLLRGYDLTPLSYQACFSKETWFGVIFNFFFNYLHTYTLNATCRLEYNLEIHRGEKNPFQHNEIAKPWEWICSFVSHILPPTKYRLKPANVRFFTPIGIH